MTKWISVKDRLPEEHGNYLVFTKHRETLILRYIGEVGAVTHWKPLDEPPNEN